MKTYLLKTCRRDVTLIAAAFITVLSYTQCTSKQSAVSSVPNTTPKADLNKGLKDYFKDDFYVGVAVARRSINEDSTLIIKEFNSVTPENDMKVGVLHPAENTWNWKNADDIVAFAERHKIHIRGHNLLWHSQDAKWMYTAPDGKPASKELVLQRLKDHIFTVMNRYKGKIYAWDVVNEAVDDSADSTVIYRTNSPWWKLFQSPEFIDAAFRYAHEADPKAKLYYNDYNSEKPNKHRKIYKLLKRLKDNGVPIDGVGFQAHWKLNDPTAEQLRTALNEVISLGLDVQFTELDITIRLPQPRPAGAPANAPQAQAPDEGFTPEAEAKQIAQYKMVFDIMKEYRKNISAVTFWNVTDKSSWLDGRGGGLAGGAAASQTGPSVIRKAYPLLFDVNGQRKKVYWAVVNK